MRTIIVLYFYIAAIKGQESDWDYEKVRGALDPKHWYLKYEPCNGQRQSPIPITCLNIHPDHTLAPLKFINYTRSIMNLNMHNDGHTIKIDVPANASLKLYSDSLSDPYRLAQFHFHWGTSKEGGSEHTIQGKRWPLEMHLVHVDERIPADQTILNKNGMVVVSVLFDVQKIPEMRNKHVKAIERLSIGLDYVKLEGQAITVPPFVIGDLLPDGAADNYLRYSGSLTTPPCAEVVEWFIITKTLPLPPDVLDKLRQTRHRVHELQGNNGDVEVAINENDRPLQPLHARPIRLHGEMGDLPRCLFMGKVFK